MCPGSPGHGIPHSRLRPRETLWTVRLEQAAQDVALTLVSRGYLEARVTAAARRAPGGADAVFTVQAGPRARVGEARVEGAGTLEAGLRSRIRPHPGDVFRREHAKAAAEAMRRQLVEAGHWRAQVDVEESYDPASGRVGLVFRAQPGPLTGVEFQGARIGHGLRANVEGLLREGGLKADALEEAIDVLDKGFRRQGYGGSKQRCTAERGSLAEPPRHEQHECAHRPVEPLAEQCPIRGDQHRTASRMVAGAERIGTCRAFRAGRRRQFLVER